MEPQGGTKELAVGGRRGSQGQGLLGRHVAGLCVLSLPRCVPGPGSEPLSLTERRHGVKDGLAGPECEPACQGHG